MFAILPDVDCLDLNGYHQSFYFTKYIAFFIKTDAYVHGNFFRVIILLNLFLCLFMFVISSCNYTRFNNVYKLSQFKRKNNSNQHIHFKQFTCWIDYFQKRTNQLSSSQFNNPGLFFLWGYVKLLSRVKKPAMLENLQTYIELVIADIRPNLCEKLMAYSLLSESIKCSSRRRILYWLLHQEWHWLYFTPN